MSSVWSRIRPEALGNIGPPTKRRKLSPEVNPHTTLSQSHGNIPAAEKGDGQNGQHKERERSVSEETIEVPDDSFWPRTHELGKSSASAMQARQYVVRQQFDWQGYTTHWAFHKELRIKESSCLGGLRFAFSGHLPSLYRESAIILIERHGGICCQIGSPEVDYVVLGNDGSSKKQKVIRDLKINCISEDKLVALIEEHLPKRATTEADAQAATEAATTPRSRSSTNSSSPTSPVLDRHLNVVEMHECELILKAAQQTLKKAEILHSVGLKTLTDSELKELLSYMCKYTVDASRRFKPSLLTYLRLEGVGRGLMKKYRDAWDEGKRRNLNMGPFSGSERPAQSLPLPRRPLSVTEDHEVVGHDAGTANTESVNQQPNNPEESRPISKPPLHHDSDTDNQTLNEDNSEPSSKSSDIPIKGRLPEEEKSSFWCAQCRRGPATCMHTHRMIGNVVNNSDTTPLLDLMFARWLLEEWDAIGQNRFGVEPYFRRHRLERKIEQERLEWLVLIKPKVDQRQNRLLGSQLKDAVRSLKNSIACFEDRSENIRPVREGQGPNKGFRGNQHSSSEMEIDEPTANDRRIRPPPDTDRRRRSLRNAGGRKLGQREFDVDDDGLEYLSDDMSIFSEDSLLETPPPSLGRMLTDAPMHELIDIARSVSSRASQILLARYIKAVCNEDDSLKELVEARLADLGMAIDAVELRTDPALPASDTPAVPRTNMIDQIAPTEDIDGGTKCARCGIKFKSDGSRLSDECFYHDGNLCWANTGQPIDNIKLVSKVLGAHTFYTCCKGNIMTPGCKQGMHLEASTVAGVDGAQKSLSPLYSIELAPSASNTSKEPSVSAQTKTRDARRASSLHEGIRSTSTPANVSVGQPPLKAEADYKSIPNYASDFPQHLARNANALLEEIKDTEFYKSANPYELSNDGEAGLLYPSELRLAGHLRWYCNFYLLRKRQLFKSALDSHMSGHNLSANAFARSVPGSNPKCSAFFNAYKRTGLLDRNRFDKWLGPAEPQEYEIKQTPVPNNLSVIRNVLLSTADGSSRSSNSSDYYRRIFESISDTASGAKQPAGSTLAPASAFETFQSRQPQQLQSKLQASDTSALSPQSANTTRNSSLNTGRKLLPMPRSWQEAIPADREMVRLKRQGTFWVDIWPIWRKLEPEALKDYHSLAMRYSKLKREFEDEWEKEEADGKS